MIKLCTEVETKFRASLFSTALFVLFSGHASAETLKEAVEQALATNPDIASVAANREAVDQELRQARGLYLPQIDVTGSIAYEDTDDKETRKAGAGNSFNPSSASLTVRQRVFDGFEASATTERDVARAQSAANRVNEKSEFLALDSIGVYLDVLRQRELVGLSKENVQTHLNIIDSLQERLKAGGGSMTDVVQAQARAARARNTLTEEYNSLRDAEANFARVVGHFPDELAQPDALEDSALPGSLDGAVEATVRQNPTIRILEADVGAAAAEVALSESSFYPKVNLAATSSYQDEVASNRENWTANHSVGLELGWNIFRGGIDVAGRREALSRLSERKSDRYSAVVDAQRDVRQSWFALEEARQSISELSAAVRLNKATRDDYLQQFEVAQRTLLDVLDAENELFQSHGKLLTAMENEQLAAYRVLALSGNLLGRLGVAAPEQSKFEDEGWFESVLQ